MEDPLCWAKGRKESHLLRYRGALRNFISLKLSPVPAPCMRVVNSDNTPPTQVSGATQGKWVPLPAWSVTHSLTYQSLSEPTYWDTGLKWTFRDVLFLLSLPLCLHIYLFLIHLPMSICPCLSLFCLSLSCSVSSVSHPLSRSCLYLLCLSLCFFLSSLPPLPLCEC